MFNSAEKATRCSPSNRPRKRSIHKRIYAKVECPPRNGGYFEGVHEMSEAFIDWMDALK
jgi:hypothetical protein